MRSLLKGAQARSGLPGLQTPQNTMPQAHGFQPAAHLDPGKCQVLMRDTGLTAMPPPPCRESLRGREGHR